LKISRLKIRNFRGIKSADLLFPDHVVFIGDNNTGKSTILEAIDLVLGPDRLNRRPPIDEHDFYIGKYLSSDASNESVEEPAEPAEAGDSEAAADEVEVTAGGGGRA
jgi:putative ATP-dependent endonuclease of OLD family